MTLTGERKHILLRLFIAPGYEDTLSNVYVLIIDISDLKQMEEDMRRFRRPYGIP
ncbi:MAG: hypothetical protein AB1480_15715 [Nitrospirota bacterium]